MSAWNNVQIILQWDELQKYSLLGKNLCQYGFLYGIEKLNVSESVNKQALFDTLKKLYFNETHAYKNCEMMYG